MATQRKLRDGDTVRLTTGTVYTDIRRLSKGGHRWVGRIVLDCGRNDTPDVGTVHVFHDGGAVVVENPSE